MAKEIASSDYIPQIEGVVDYRKLKFQLVQGNITPIGEREFQDVVKMELFMQELLTIVVNKTSDKNAPPAVGVGVNNDQVWLPRGQKISIPRYFVEVLASRQERHFRTFRNEDPNADEGMKTMTENTQPYSFQVLHDPNPKGQAWLERVSREGC